MAALPAGCVIPHDRFHVPACGSVERCFLRSSGHGATVPAMPSPIFVRMQAFTNFGGGPPLPPPVEVFLAAQASWLAAMVAKYPADPYWVQIAALLEQLRGLHDGCALRHLLWL